MGSFSLFHFLFVPAVIVLVLAALISLYFLIRPTRWDPLKEPEQVKARPGRRVISGLCLIVSLALLAALLLGPLWLAERVIEEHKSNQTSEQPSAQ